MNIVCVLRKSAQFNEQHVYWLQRQCAEFLPEWNFICYSDVPLACNHRILKTNWPTWWAKFEAYGDPDLKGPTLVLDLDTVLVRHFKPTAKQLEHSYIARHPTHDGFRAAEGFNGAFLLLTEQFRRRLYQHFSSDPYFFITESRYDDQGYYMRHWSNDLRRIQDEFPDVTLSYKLNVLPNGIYEDTCFILFHGQPRPWDVTLPWIPKCSHQDPSLAQAV